MPFDDALVLINYALRIYFKNASTLRKRKNRLTYFRQNADLLANAPNFHILLDAVDSILEFRSSRTHVRNHAMIY